MRKITGVCQQLDIYFDVLTVQENLSIVASIKGIPPNYMIQEVSRTSSYDMHVAICFNKSNNIAMNIICTAYYVLNLVYKKYLHSMIPRKDSSESGNMI